MSKVVRRKGGSVVGSEDLQKFYKKTYWGLTVEWDIERVSERGNVGEGVAIDTDLEQRVGVG